MVDIQRIIQLKAAGESNRSIARLLVINRKTVNEYIQALKSITNDFAALSQLKEAALIDLIPQAPVISKPEAYYILQSLIPSYQKELKKPGLPI